MDAKIVKTKMLDAMWDFLQMGNQKSDIPTLKEYCKVLICMMSQKTAGQEKYKNKDDYDFKNLDAIVNIIVVSALSLYLSGDLDKLEELTDEQDKEA